MTSHHFENHHALVTGTRCVKTIQAIDHAVNCAIESKSHRRRLKIIVDCLGNSDNGPALLKELLGSRQRAITTHDDQAVDLESVQGRFGAIHNILGNGRNISFTDFRREVPFISGS